MPTTGVGKAIQRLRTAVLAGDVAAATDAELLKGFLERRDEAAFTALVHRHGPMVHGVCRRVLRDHHDADDAFQATFLVLVRKAGTISPRDLVGHWLHGVAYRTALEARTQAARFSLASKSSLLSPARRFWKSSGTLNRSLAFAIRKAPQNSVK